MRPAHLIAPGEVAAWLADSANRRITYHRTTREAAANIVAKGVDIERSVIGTFGQGFYTVTDPQDLPGDAEVTVAVRILHGLVGPYDAVEDFIDALVHQRFGRQQPITPQIARVIREELRRLGYDGIVAFDGGGDGIDYVIALLPAAVKVVLS